MPSSVPWDWRINPDASLPGGGAPSRIELDGGAWIDLWPVLISEAEASACFAALVAELPLAPEVYRIAGRQVQSPRLVAWHGDPGTAYKYSGLHHEPGPWTPSLGRLRDLVVQTTGLRFNSVLANLYRDGRDSVGWHADAEARIGPSAADRWIASLSFGAARQFVLRHKKKGWRHVFELGHGSLLVMRGRTQELYRHAVPKTTRRVGPRLNLTFRLVCPPSGGTNRS